MNNQKQMPLYSDMLTLDEVTKDYNQQLTADICRKYLPIENFNINF